MTVNQYGYPDMMRAAIWNGPNNFQYTFTKTPKISKNSILIAVKSCAICGSDLRINRYGNKRVEYPRILGHEISGEVVEVGINVTDFQVGDRVATGADLSCRNCKYCLSGQTNSCELNLALGYQFDGGFAEYVVLNESVLNGGPIKKFNGSLKWEHAALAEPLACCLNGFERITTNNSTRNSLVVFGGGPIGQMLLLLGKSIFDYDKRILIEPNEYRRDLGLRLAATEVIDPTKHDPIKKVMSYTEGAGADAVFTACSVEATHSQAIKMVSRNGAVNFFGGLAGSYSSVPIDTNYIHYSQVLVTGSHGSTPAQHALALDLIEKGKIDMDQLITSRLPLAQINQAFRLAEAGNECKIVLFPNGD